MAEPSPAAAQLHDLRLLYLAHEIEAVFEGLERALHRHLPSGHVRDLLEPLFEGGPGHQRLEKELERLNRIVEGRRGEVDPLDLLHALAECEAMALDFYSRRAKDLADPALQDLFRSLAREEARHLQAVEEALSIQESLER